LRVLIVEDDERRLLWFRSRLIGVPFDFTKDVEEAKRLIDEVDYTQIFLDHDLADEHYAVWQEGSTRHDETTGYAVAKYLAENPERSRDAEIIIHSLNPLGSERMERKLKETRRAVRRVPFLQLQKVA
jgi:CheY-like chemotaxis protein